MSLASPFQQEQFERGTARGRFQPDTAQRLKAARHPAQIAARTFGNVMDGQKHRFPDPALIEKTRRNIDFRGNVWEVDEFFGENAGLVIAEVELESENQSFEKPEWIAREVTGDKRYYNANLIANPFRNWKSDK